MDICPTPLRLVPGSPLESGMIALAVIFPIFVIACLGIFLANRNTSVFLRKRPLHILFVAVVGMVVPWFSFVLYDLIGPENVPCWLFKFLCYGTYALLVVPTILKLSSYRNERALIRLREFVSNLGPKDDLILEFGDHILQAEASWRTTYAHLVMTFCSSRKNAKASRTKILNAKFCNSRAFVPLWFALTASPFLLVFFITLATSPVNQKCSGCELDAADCIALLVIAPIVFLVGFSTVKSQTVAKDPLQIVRQCVGVWMIGMTSIVGWVLLLVDPNGLQQMHNEFRWRILLLLTAAAAAYYQTVYQVLRSRGLQLRRELLISNNFNYEERFQDIMRDKHTRAALQKHMNSELSSEILEFLEAVTKFKTDFPNIPPSSRVSLSREIMDTFIARGAKREVNLSSSIRDRVLQQAEKRELSSVSYSSSPPAASVPVDPAMFDAAYDSVKEGFLMDGFARFLRNLKSETASSSTAARVQTMSKSELAPSLAAYQATDSNV